MNVGWGTWLHQPETSHHRSQQYSCQWTGDFDFLPIPKRWQAHFYMFKNTTVTKYWWSTNKQERYPHLVLSRPLLPLWNSNITDQWTGTTPTPGVTTPTVTIIKVILPINRNNTYTWWEAKEFCENAGGYLVQVLTRLFLTKVPKGTNFVRGGGKTEAQKVLKMGKFHMGGGSPKPLVK